MAVTLTWEPRDGLNKLAKNLRARQILNRQLNQLMITMVNETHRHAGMPKWPVSKRAEREGSRTGYKTGRLQRGWRPVAGKAKIENRVAYAADFYYGHGPRTVTVPAHYRRLRRKGKTVGTTMMRPYQKRERAQPARPIRWTKRYIKKAEEKILQHVIKK